MSSKTDSEEVLKTVQTTSEKLGDETFSFVPHRVFMNHVDAYNSKYIASNLADQYYGEKKKDQYMQMSGEGADMRGEDFKMEVPDERNKYEIIGTLSTVISKKTEDISYTIAENSTNFMEEIKNCGTIIYDITRNKSEIPKAIDALKFLISTYDEIKDLGPKTYKNHPKTQTFILISTIMTWAKTKNKFSEGASPFTDAQYRRRKSHPDYVDHIACEREVMALGKKHKTKLKIFVLASGFTYGYEEESLDLFFKLAWLNSQHLPVFGMGTNRIPLIHVTDLARVVTRLVMHPPSNISYILAVEPVSSKLKKIVESISKGLGKGYIQEVHSLEEALRIDGVDKKFFDQFSVNLNMQPAFILESLPFDWQYETGLPANISRVIEEFKESRELTPFKIMMHGPPCSGKTRLAKRICEKYGLHYISVKTLIDETLQMLRDNITEAKIKMKLKQERELEKMLAMEEEEEDQDMEEEELEEEEEVIDIEEWEEQIRDIETSLSSSENNKLPDEQVINLLKTFLQYNICQNQGFVLDGFPKTMQQVQELFGGTSLDEEENIEEEDADEEDKIAAITNSKFMPEFVFSLQAPDSVLCERIKKLQEKDIEGTHYTEEHMKRRIENFREINTEDDTILNFFDEMEVHPILIDVTTDESENMDAIFQTICNILGKPVTFGESLEDKLKASIESELEKKRQIEMLEAQKKAEELEAIENYREKMANWTETLEQLQIEEEKVIVAESEPLRKYLMQFIFPTLTKALMEVVKIKPDDPVDYVAEYLFKINPEGRLFDPSYSENGQRLLEICKQASSTMNI
ncbi:hypothetical protein WA026_005783 [Henosepilachna vigintioctopunctata]|uniref:Adenylate kinase 7 n=1 Tax=Henosepilachna vigintioctopunctata TaxID=420089 RepID=A0AAW1U2U3_9CUCU